MGDLTGRKLSLWGGRADAERLIDESIQGQALSVVQLEEFAALVEQMQNVEPKPVSTQQGLKTTPLGPAQQTTTPHNCSSLQTAQTSNLGLKNQRGSTSLNNVNERGYQHDRSHCEQEANEVRLCPTCGKTLALEIGTLKIFKCGHMIDDREPARPTSQPA